LRVPLSKLENQDGYGIRRRNEYDGRYQITLRYVSLKLESSAARMRNRVNKSQCATDGEEEDLDDSTYELDSSSEDSDTVELEDVDAEIEEEPELTEEDKDKPVIAFGKATSHVTVINIESRSHNDDGICYLLKPPNFA
jgi:hypothetical protein